MNVIRYFRLASVLRLHLKVRQYAARNSNWKFEFTYIQYY